jgi:SnoaL-like protein
MSTSANVRTIQVFWDAFNARDWESMLRPFAAGVRFFNNTLNTGGVGIEEWEQYIRGYVAAFPDAQLIDQDFIDAGPVVVSIATNRGTDAGAGALPTLAATQRRCSWRNCYIWRFDARGAIVSAEGFSDLLRPMIELGHVRLDAFEAVLDLERRPLVPETYFQRDGR